MDLEVISQRNNQHTGTLIFLHGATRTGKWQKEMFIDLLGEKAAFNHIKIIFPTSGEGFFYVKNKVTNLWFKMDKPEQGEIPVMYLDDIDNAASTIKKLIDEEVKNGIPLNRIVIGGISQGAMLSLHGVYRSFPEVAGCIAVSGALFQGDAIIEAAKKRENNPPLLVTHGVLDDILPLICGKEINRRMKEAGVNVEYHEFPDAYHELTADELEVIIKKIEEWVPEK